MSTIPSPASSPCAKWLENEKSEFERIILPAMPEVDFTLDEAGNYTGDALHVYLGWIARGRKALDDAISAFPA